MKHIHFTGAGGVGMCGLAHIALDLGYEVTGSDMADSAMLETLRARGVPLCVGHNPALVRGAELLVYSSAVPESDPERQEAKRLGIRQLRRGDYLNLLALHFPVRVAVSGSHGKTSTSAMLVHILKNCGMKPGYMVGGKVNGWERSAAAGDGSVFVSETDESDGSQAGFPATLAVILNIDDDHCWSAGGTRGLERSFLELAFSARQVLAWRAAATEKLFEGWKRCTLMDTPLDGEMPLPGWHVRVDAAMAVRAAVMLGIDEAQARRAIASFPGVARRMSVRYRSDDGKRILLEDYAHHPAELKATLDALREAYPAHRLLVVFQPHRMERVERYGDRFAELLSTVDWCGLVEPFGAWRTDGYMADIHAIAAKITASRQCLPNIPKAIAEAALPHWQAPAVLAIIGAGDVNKAIDSILEKASTV